MVDENNKQLTNTEIYNQVFTFLIAGHETTSLTACWTLFLLAKHPNIQQEVKEEIDEILDGSDHEICWEDLDKLKLLDNCIKESMRLYPVAITTDRTAVGADKLGPYCIPAGTHVMIGLGSLHRLGSYWKDPDEFDPHRFDKKGDQILQSEEDTTPHNKRETKEEVGRRKPLARILLLDQERFMKPRLDTGLKVCDEKGKKKQRHTTNEKQNMYFNIFNKNNQYFEP